MSKFNEQIFKKLGYDLYFGEDGMVENIYDFNEEKNLSRGPVIIHGRGVKSIQFNGKDYENEHVMYTVYNDNLNKVRCTGFNYMIICDSNENDDEKEYSFDLSCRTGIDLVENKIRIIVSHNEKDPSKIFEIKVLGNNNETIAETSRSSEDEDEFNFDQYYDVIMKNVEDYFKGSNNTQSEEIIRHIKSCIKIITPALKGITNYYKVIAEKKKEIEYIESSIKKLNATLYGLRYNLTIRKTDLAEYIEIYNNVTEKEGPTK